MIGLLERFYALTGGAILLDGRPIDAVDVGSYRDVIGVVSQEPNLFGMTIQDNIALGCAGPVTDEQVEGAATQANAHDFIMSLPDGYQTAVGTKGAQLSGGQKQVRPSSICCGGRHLTGAPVEDRHCPRPDPPAQTPAAG